MLPFRFFFTDRKTEQEIRQWLETLTEAQRQELAAIDSTFKYGRKGSDDVKAVTQDWIEEHGGNREWWMDFEARG